VARRQVTPAVKRVELGQQEQQRTPFPQARDVLLVERGLFESRARARAAIEAGFVVAGGNRF